MRLNDKLGGPIAALVLVLGLAGCATKKGEPAPVEERVTHTRAEARVTGGLEPTRAAAAPAAATVVAEPGTYIVKPGDTLIRVGLETGQNWRDLVRWNGIENANLIEVGQVLRVMPPGAEAAAVTRPVAALPKLETRPIEAKGSGGKPEVAAKPAVTAASPPIVASAPVAPKLVADDEVQWAWPANGAIVSSFDEPRNKGLTLGGKLGDPVLAAADGVVMYAGTGIRGLGKLIIIKHSPQFLSAYAHNHNLLVKEDQVVRKGQKVAEMGATDAERVQLHFEVRRQGKPVDPQKVLPAR
jgi:lipoprotein NlpD